jgi:RNA polymerase sigma factor (sigma-70 family)
LVPGGHYAVGMAATDGQLLAEFVQSRSDQAFAQIVQRYADLVYAAARRQVADAHVAEDVAQATFVVLARRAKSVNPNHLAGWLLRTARYCGKDVLRSQARRIHYERQAASRRPIVTSPIDASADEISAGLDEAISGLRDRESTAVALRYLQNKPMNEVAAAPETSVDAAEKVVSRSLLKLRRLLKSRGIFLSTTAALAAGLSHIPAEAAPANFAVPPAGAPAASLTIAKGAIHMILWSKIKAAAAVAAAVLLTGGAGIVVIDHVLAADAPPAPAAAPTPAADAAPADYLTGVESPFLELTGCRINQTLNLKLTSEPQPQTTVKWYAEEYPQVHWTIAPDLADKVTGYAITITPVDNPDAKEVLQSDKGTELQPLLDTCRQPGEYQVQLTANGADSKPLAQATAHVRVHKIPYAQIMISDFQPDGTIRFTYVDQDINGGNQDYHSGGFRNSDMVHVEKMADEQGKPVKFTTFHQNGMYGYHFTLNEPVPPGRPIMWADIGSITGMVQNLGGGLYQYSFNHSPGANVPTRRVELLVLPAGAKLVAVDPDLPHQQVNGRIQLFLDKTIPVGGSSLVSIRYRLNSGG